MKDSTLECILNKLNKNGCSKENIKKGNFSLSSVCELLPENWEAHKVACKQQIMFAAIVI